MQRNDLNVGSIARLDRKLSGLMATLSVNDQRFSMSSNGCYFENCCESVGRQTTIKMGILTNKIRLKQIIEPNLIDILPIPI
jgi:hypothetical protein